MFLMNKFSLFIMVILINLNFLASFTVPDIDIVKKNNDQRTAIETSISDKMTDKTLVSDKATEEDIIVEKEIGERLTVDKGTEEDFIAEKQNAELLTLDARTQEQIMASSVLSIPGLSETETKAFIAKRTIPTLKGTASGIYTVIEPAGAGWGYYRDWQYCTGGSWVIGYAQRVEPPQGRGDDTALNSIELICADTNGNIISKIRSYDGIWGYWGNPVFCNGQQNFLRGVQLKVESDQGRGDDTAANDSRFWCASGNIIQATNGAPWGTWRQAAFCPSNSFICGLQTKFEPDQNRGDDTGMNGSKFLCCSI